MLEVPEESVRRPSRLSQRSPDAEHDRPAQERQPTEYNEDELRYLRRALNQLEGSGRHRIARPLKKHCSEMHCRHESVRQVLWGAAARSVIDADQRYVSASPSASDICGVQPNSIRALSTARHESCNSPGRAGANSIGVCEPAASISVVARSFTDVATPVPTLYARSSTGP